MSFITLKQRVSSPASSRQAELPLSLGHWPPVDGAQRAQFATSPTVNRQVERLDLPLRSSRSRLIILDTTSGVSFRPFCPDLFAKRRRHTGHPFQIPVRAYQHLLSYQVTRIPAWHSVPIFGIFGTEVCIGFRSIKCQLSRVRRGAWNTAASSGQLDWKKGCLRGSIPSQKYSKLVLTAIPRGRPRKRNRFVRPRRDEAHASAGRVAVAAETGGRVLREGGAGVLICSC